MADRECSHQNVIEAGELVCTDCGLVLGPIFHHDNRNNNNNNVDEELNRMQHSVYASQHSRVDEERKLRETVSNALSHMFLDSESLIDEAVSTWKDLSQFRNVDTCVGRRRLAYVLWDSLMSRGVIRKKEDIEAICQARPGDIARLERKSPKTRVYRPASSFVDTLGAWVGMPYRHRRIITRYMRTFEYENSYLTHDPELLAAASLLYVCGRLKKRKSAMNDSGAPDCGLSWELPEYMAHITPKSVASLVDADLDSLKCVYKKVSLRRNKKL